jgi:hypothetical protein
VGFFISTLRKKENMMSRTSAELLDVDTWAKLRKAAPKVTVIPFDMAQAAVKALRQYMNVTQAHTDLDGQKYWEGSLRDVLDESSLVATPTALGATFRSFGLTLWRETNGYHVAWSSAQFKILKDYFKL